MTLGSVEHVEGLLRGNSGAVYKDRVLTFEGQTIHGAWRQGTAVKRVVRRGGPEAIWAARHTRGAAQCVLEISKEMCNMIHLFHKETF